MRKISWDIKPYSENGPIAVKLCNGVVFKNTGDVDAYINDIPLPAGETMDDFDKNEPGDVIDNAFRLRFEPNTTASNKLVVAIRREAYDIPASEECNYKNEVKPAKK